MGHIVAVVDSRVWWSSYLFESGQWLFYWDKLISWEIEDWCGWYNNEKKLAINGLFNWRGLLLNNKSWLDLKSPKVPICDKVCELKIGES